MPQQKRICINCGKELPDGVSFCGFCGVKQTISSPEPSADDFNTEAPTRVEGAVPSTPPVPTAAPESGTPEEKMPGTDDIQAEHSVQVDTALPDGAPAASTDGADSTKGISPAAGSGQGQETASEWKNPFWLTTIFTAVILPAGGALYALLQIPGSLILALLAGVLYTAAIRKRCKLESRSQLVGTALSAAAAWFALILISRGG